MARKKTSDNKLVSSIYDKFKRFTDRMVALHESPYPHVSLSPSEHEAQNRALKRELTKEAKDAEQGRGFRKSQTVKAHRTRGKLSESGETIRVVIKRLATSQEHSSDSAKQLWPKLYAELDQLGCDPTQNDVETYYDPFSGEKSKRIGFSRFSNIVSEVRSKKVSR